MLINQNNNNNNTIIDNKNSNFIPSIKNVRKILKNLLDTDIANNDKSVEK